MKTAFQSIQTVYGQAIKANQLAKQDGGQALLNLQSIDYQYQQRASFIQVLQSGEAIALQN